jgi:hypothetical protein
MPLALLVSRQSCDGVFKDNFQRLGNFEKIIRAYERPVAAGAEWVQRRRKTAAAHLAGELRQVIRDRYPRKRPELFSAHKA